MNWSDVGLGIAIGVFLCDRLHKLSHSYLKEYKRCNRCNERYRASKSTSRYESIYCSLECEYFQVIDLMVEKGIPLHMAIHTVNKEKRYARFLSLGGDKLN